jgi:hypothetical protein
MFHRSELEVEDAKDGKSFKGAVARPPKGSDRSKVGVLQQQKAPLVHESEQSVGSEKIGKGKKGSKSPKKAQAEAAGKKKQAQEMNRPDPKVVCKKK